jgi:hypothetical protein
MSEPVKLGAEFKPTSCVWSMRTPAGRAFGLIIELRAAGKISSADRDVLLNVIKPIAEREHQEFKVAHVRTRQASHASSRPRDRI